jgi:hypothetical protein
MGDEPGGAGRFGDPGDRSPGAPHLEGADGLPLLALEPDRDAEPSRERGGFDQRGSNRDSDKGIRRGSQILD